MEPNKSLFYKDRKWNDFHYYNGTVLPELKIVQPSIYHEYRGMITTTYHSDFYDKLLPANDRNEGLKFNHDRYSKSKINVLRGLHYDDKTWKLISCPHGKLYLVVLDLREKQNKPLFSRGRELSRIFVDAVKQGKLTPYENDSLIRPLSIEELCITQKPVCEFKV